MRLLLAAPCLALTLSCASAPPAEDLPFRIEEQSVGKDLSFRGAAYGVGGRMWSSGVGGTILHRAAGEGSWSNPHVPGASTLDFRDIDVRLDGQILTMAAGTGADSAVYFSEGPAGVWSKVLANPDADGFFDSIAIDEEGFCMLVGDPLDGHFTFFTSRDGRSWERADRRRGPSAREGEHAFAASGSILVASAPGEFWFATGGDASEIWHTDSHGAVWFATDAPSVGGAASKGWFGLGVGPTGDLIAVGGDYQQPQEPSTFAILRAGTPLWEVGRLPGFRSAVCAVPDRPGTWITVGSHGADWSQDNGLTWNPLPLPGGHALTPAGSGAVLVVGGPDEPHRIVRFVD